MNASHFAAAKPEHGATEHRATWMGALALVLVGAAACTPTSNHAVDAARRDYLAARSDPMIASQASAELNDARQTLIAAEEKLDDDDQQEAEHLARLASTKVETARYAAEADQLKKELSVFKAREVERGIALTMGDVLFETGSARLTSAAKQHLAPLLAFLRTHPDRAILIEGHADSTGDPARNQKLSEERAQAVEAYLVAGGVGPTRIASRGLGESNPIASNTSAVGRAENRRVEMLVLNPGETVKLSQAVVAP